MRKNDVTDNTKASAAPCVYEEVGLDQKVNSGYRPARADYASENTTDRGSEFPRCAMDKRIGHEASQQNQTKRDRAHD